jgi:hypothetical protein
MKKKKKMKLYKASGGKKLSELGKRTSFKTVMDHINNKTHDKYVEDRRNDKSKCLKKNSTRDDRCIK